MMTSPSTLPLPRPMLPVSTVWCFTNTLHSDSYPAIDPTSPAASSYAGKAILITGASKGLGRAFAIGYAEAGASYIIIGSRTGASGVAKAALEAAAKAKRAPPAIVEITIDVCDQTSVDAAATRVREEVGRLDVLVNNAGYMAPSAPLLEQDSTDYLRTFDVNVGGTYRVTKAFLPLMLEGGDKTVVVLTSVGAHGVECAAAYSIAKFALCRFAQFLVEEYGEQVQNA
jgi:NAD(P)-dependent dehydrogenase (short-subunit alcohol dehydrogenase family)